MGARRLAFAIAIISSVLLPSAQSIAAPADKVRLSATISNLSDAGGEIYCGLFESADAFPSDRDKALRWVRGEPQGAGSAFCTFQEIEPGTYAVSVLQDLDGDREMDSSLVGYPQEPWGVSNNVPRKIFGPPDFDKAAVQVNEDQQISIRLNHTGSSKEKG